MVDKPSRKGGDEEDSSREGRASKPAIDRTVLIVIVVIILMWSVGVIEGVIGCLVYQHISVSQVQVMELEMENKRLKDKIESLERKPPSAAIVESPPAN